MKRITLLLFFLISHVSLLTSNAQSSGNVAYWAYIEQYKGLAQAQMQKYGVPASITLAQGLLESAAGRSELATQANNHFGIKVGTGWSGPFVVKHDDRKNERFRKYNNVEESYEDHSQFLKKPRYASLFQIPVTDYVGWAQGLKQCGYATSPTYAEKLVSIVERYGLQQYVTGTLPAANQTIGQQTNSVQTQTQATAVQTQAANVEPVSYKERAQQLFYAQHPVRTCNGNFYIVAQPGDDLDYISVMTGVRKRRLCRYNELPTDYEVCPGDIIFMQKKRDQADAALQGHQHIIQDGESLHDIAQHYGIRLSSLYKMNMIPSDYAPRVGQRLQVR